MRSFEYRVDVSDSSELPGPLYTSVTVHVPDAESLPVDPVVLFCFPGGGYNRRYFDLSIPDSPLDRSYSQAGHHAARGLILVACDPLGSGDSSEPDRDLSSFVNLAAANAATVEGVVAALSADAFGIGALAPSTIIGLGHSLSVVTLLAAQALWRTFDAIAPLGSSAIHSVPPRRPGVELPAGRIVDVEYAFHMDDVPAELVRADVGGYPAREDPVPAWATGRIPGGPGWPRMSETFKPGLWSEWAAEVSVPVFVGVGERDFCPDPHAEATAYRASDDVTVFVCRGMAHIHNFAGTRVRLWDRIADWAIAARAPGGHVAGQRKRSDGRPT